MRHTSFPCTSEGAIPWVFSEVFGGCRSRGAVRRLRTPRRSSRLVSGGEHWPRHQQRLRGGWPRRIQRSGGAFTSTPSGPVDPAPPTSGCRNARDAGDPWGPPVNLGTVVNTPGLEAVAALSATSTGCSSPVTAGGIGAQDIWVAYREHMHDPFDWQAAVNVGAGVNSIFHETGATYVENDGRRAATLLPQRPPRPGGTDIYVSDLLVTERGVRPPWSRSSADHQGTAPIDQVRRGGDFFFSPRPGGLGTGSVVGDAPGCSIRGRRRPTSARRQQRPR